MVCFRASTVQQLLKDEDLVEPLKREFCIELREVDAGTLARVYSSGT